VKRYPDAVTVFERLGDRAVRIARPAVSARALAKEIRGWPGVVDVVVAREAIGVYFDGEPQIDPARVAALAGLSDVADPVREHVLRAVYDGADLAALPRDTVELHAGAVYTVDTMGFMPGFAYLVGLPPALAVVPRLATPRTRVPQNALGIAGGFTGVYPFATSGGWHLIGRVVDARMFDERGPLLAVGDRVRFVPA